MGLPLPTWLSTGKCCLRLSCNPAGRRVGGASRSTLGDQAEVRRPAMLHGADMKTMTLAEFHASMKSQGVPIGSVTFRCPMCGTLQSANALIAAGAGETLKDVEGYLGFSCVGRWTGQGAHLDSNPPGHGCDWTLGGLMKIHELEVIDDDGNRQPRFMPG